MVKPSRTSPATHKRLILLHRLITAIQSSRRSAQACLAQYPKQFAGLFAALLLGGVGATYALAAFAPDPAEQTIRQVVESIALPELVGSANLDAPALNLYRSDLTRASDTADSLLACCDAWAWTIHLPLNFCAPTQTRASCSAAVGAW